ncbi:MAG: hypothetical protein JOY84_22940 [Curvibacter sp.]|nr:hypothetical protein [Curvibacter sp.]
MRHLRTWGLLVCLTPLLWLGACSRPMEAEVFRQRPEAVFLLDTVALLQRHDDAALALRVAPALSAQVSAAGLAHAAQALPAEGVQDLQPVALEVEGGPDGPRRLSTVAAELHFAHAGPVLVTARLQGEPGHFLIRGFYIEALAAPLAETHALSLRGKGAWHAGFALLALALLGFTLWTLQRCLRLPGLRYRALWALLIVSGAMDLSLDWSSGAVTLNPLALSLFNVSLIRQGWIGPWILSCSVPVGALLFLAVQRIRALKAARTAAKGG